MLYESIENYSGPRAIVSSAIILFLSTRQSILGAAIILARNGSARIIPSSIAEVKRFAPVAPACSPRLLPVLFRVDAIFVVGGIFTTRSAFPR